MLLAVAALAVVGLAAWASWTAAGVDLGRIHPNAPVVYSAGRVLTVGLSVGAADLDGTLRRLGYVETGRPPAVPGEYRRSAGGWELFLRARSDPAATRPPLRIRLGVAGGRVATLATTGGASLTRIEMEPEALSGLGEGGYLRHPVSLETMPPHLIDAVLAAEDRRFFQHPGVDGRAVLRALRQNLRQGRVQEGGSTLTQQLVKNLALTPRRTVGRKLQEAALALALERRHDKRTILAAYLNDVYLGQDGGLAVYGMSAAARSYFGKEVDRLTVGEAALLAGIIRAPNAYSPVQHPDRARERRDLVLDAMGRLGTLDIAGLARARAEGVVTRPGTPGRILGPYLADHARGEVEALAGEGGIGPAGLHVYTTMDPVLQQAAEAAVARGLDRLERSLAFLRRADRTARLQAALVALDPQTGDVRAMVGGRDYGASQFNRAAQARRQPGSAFKPFVYLAGLRPGPRGEPPHFTAVSHLEDGPLSFRVGPAAWTPRNYEGRYEGTVTVRRALEQSLNAATVWMAEAVGFDEVIRAARDAGLTSPLAPVPALALGSFEVSPLELAAAYAPFANGGHRVVPTTVRAVVDRTGAVLEPRPTPRPAAIGPEEAYVVTSLLQGVVDHGTGAAARLLGVEGPVAGKTGTTNDGRDAWFVGYTPRLVALVWVGFDQRDVLHLSGGQAALPIWADFMRTAMAFEPSVAFPVPRSVVIRDVDPANGKLAGRFCPLAVREAFLASTEPRESCTEHGPLDLLASFFQRPAVARETAVAPETPGPAGLAGVVSGR